MEPSNAEIIGNLRRVRRGAEVDVFLADGTKRVGRVGRVSGTELHLLDDPEPVELAAVADFVIRVRTGPPE